MEVISLWHCWGGMEAQVYLTAAFSSSAFFGLLFLIFLLTVPHRFSGVQVWWVCWPVKHTTPWPFNQLLVLLAVWAGATSCLKMKSACLKSMSAEGSMKCSKNSWWMGAVTLVFKKTQWTNTSRWHWTPNHHRLWKLNAGLWATWAMSFSTLPPDSKTLVYKLNTKDTADDNCSQISWHVCVWWLLMPWPQPQSSPCEVHPNSWIDFTWQSS